MTDKVQSSFENLVHEAIDLGAKFEFTQSGNGINSAFPPQALFGYTYWAHMVPPLFPQSVLMLGSGGGTVEALIREIYKGYNGVSSYTRVDIDPRREDAIICNAYDYVKSCGDQKFDYVCVDLWSGDASLDFVINDEDFIKNLRRITGKFLCINIDCDSAMNSKEHIQKYIVAGFRKDRIVMVQNNFIEWFSV